MNLAQEIKLAQKDSTLDFVPTQIEQSGKPFNFIEFMSSNPLITAGVAFLALKLFKVIK